MPGATDSRRAFPFNPEDHVSHDHDQPDAPPVADQARLIGLLRMCLAPTDKAICAALARAGGRLSVAGVCEASGIPFNSLKVWLYRLASAGVITHQKAGPHSGYVLSDDGRALLGLTYPEAFLPEPEGAEPDDDEGIDVVTAARRIIISFLERRGPARFIDIRRFVLRKPEEVMELLASPWFEQHEGFWRLTAEAPAVLRGVAQPEADVA